MKIALIALILCAGCYSGAGRYEAIGQSGQNVLLLDTATGQLEVQGIPDVPDTLPEHKPVI